jgi:phosphatidyl-myo-inositol dimannoside synthase
MNKLQGRSVWVMAKGYAPDEGGMQTYARAVAETYAALGARVTVFTQTSAGPRDEQVGPVRLVDVGAGKNLHALLRMVRAVRGERRRHGQPDLLHATTWRTSILPMLLGLPFITTFHGREFMYVSRLGRALMARIARRAARVIAVSHYTAQALVRQIPGLPLAPVVAWNGVTDGIPRREPHAGGAGVVRILSLCRFEPRKNLKVAIEAAAACHREGLRFQFTMAGRGEEHAQLTELVARLGMSDVIALPGFVDPQRALQLYREADIFIHPHITCDGERDFEGFGIAIADAMYAGAAVIAGRDGGSRELLEDGVSGFSVDGRDQAAVTAALRRLLQDGELRRSMAQAGAAHAAREFRWDKHVERILGSLPALPLR